VLICHLLLPRACRDREEALLQVGRDVQKKIFTSHRKQVVQLLLHLSDCVVLFRGRPTSGGGEGRCGACERG